MPLSARQSPSFYEIVGPLGAGGVGEVHRARDTRLEREAKTLASLNHPNVAEGLEAAHEAGVVDRDLEPANVRVTPEGHVELLAEEQLESPRPRILFESSRRIVNIELSADAHRTPDGTEIGKILEIDT